MSSVDRSNAGVSLELSTWLRLLRAHGLLLREVRRAVPERLTLSQFDVLAQVHRDKRGLTPGVLTRELLVTAGNVTGIVDRLVRMGLAERHPLPSDRRAVLVRLSPRGRDLMRRAMPKHRRDVETVLSRIPSAELTELRRLLGRVIQAFEPEGPLGQRMGAAEARPVPWGAASPLAPPRRSPRRGSGRPRQGSRARLWKRDTTSRNRTKLASE